MFRHHFSKLPDFPPTKIRVPRANKHKTSDLVAVYNSDFNLVSFQLVQLRLLKLATNFLLH